MAKLLQIPVNTPKSATVYDPTCGSGSLLIKVADDAPNGLTVYDPLPTFAYTLCL